MAAKKTGKRPKIAVVLSGGGAKGIAHVGFLKVMEQAGIHPDLIVGTSMGSIVGGLYALGFSPDSIETMLQQQDWSAVLGNKVPLNYINIEEKREYNNYIAEFPFKGIVPQLPSGAIKGHQLELLFDKLTWTAAPHEDFDDFYIPFRCVAVDMYKAEPYIFDSGNLALAMRASMSIPSIMEPVKYKGMLLVDGGLINNFPVDVAKKWGADIIIGVYVGGILPKPGQSVSMVDLMMETSLLASIIDAREKEKDCDVYIEPPLEDLTAAEFNKVDTFIARGYSESMKYYNDLLAISKKLEKYKPVERPKPHLIDSLYITQWETNDIHKKNTDKMIKGMLGNEINTYVKADDIHKEINKLFGTRLFDKIGYNITPVDSAHYKIKYTLNEAPTNTLNAAFNYSTDNKMSLIFQLVFRNLLLSSSKLETKFSISEYPSFGLRYLKYFGNHNKISLAASYRFNYSPLLTYNQTTFKVYSEFKRFYSDLIFDFNFYTSDQSVLTARYALQNFDYNAVTDMGFGSVTEYSLVDDAVSLNYKLNTLDNKHFPKSGHKLEVSAVYYIDPQYDYFFAFNDTVWQNDNPFSIVDTNFFQFRLKYNSYNPAGKKFTIENSLNVFATFNNNDYRLNSFLIGGVNDYNRFYNISFYGMPLNYLFANNGVIYKFGLRYELLQKFYIGLKLNAMFESQTLTAIGEDVLDIDNYILGAGLVLSYDSPIGPVSIVVSKNSWPGPFWTYFNIGFNF
jgi:NTE family protein